MNMTLKLFPPPSPILHPSHTLLCHPNALQYGKCICFVRSGGKKSAHLWNSSCHISTVEYRLSKIVAPMMIKNNKWHWTNVVKFLVLLFKLWTSTIARPLSSHPLSSNALTHTHTASDCSSQNKAGQIQSNSWTNGETYLFHLFCHPDKIYVMQFSHNLLFSSSFQFASFVGRQQQPHCKIFRICWRCMCEWMCVCMWRKVSS